MKILKKTFDKYFLTRHNKKYFIITDNKEFKCCDNEEKILIEDEGWRMTNLKRFEYFLKCDLSDMDYVFFFNGNSICRDEVFDNDIIPNEDEKYLCGTWLFFHNALNPYDNNKNSACYMSCKLNYAFRGGLLGGRTQEFIKMCNSCIEMIKYDLSMNYIPKWNDEAYFNKYVEIYIKIFISKKRWLIMKKYSAIKDMYYGNRGGHDTIKIKI